MHEWARCHDEAARSSPLPLAASSHLCHANGSRYSKNVRLDFFWTDLTLDDLTTKEITEM